MSQYYIHKREIDGNLYILYGFEGNIAIWQRMNKTQSAKREYYANPGVPVRSNSVREIRNLINQNI